jgi:hypothetical protein
MKNKLSIFVELLNKVKIYTKYFLVLYLVILISSCSDKNSLEYQLKHGLKDYPRKRPIDSKQFNENVELEHLAFFKVTDSTHKMVFHLGDKTVLDSIKNYSLAIHTFVDEQFLKEGKKYLYMDYKPELISVGSHNYLIKEFATEAKRIDSVDLFLYDRDKYRRILGKKITVRNIGL